jgi:hypothetical protein
MLFKDGVHFLGLEAVKRSVGVEGEDRETILCTKRWPLVSVLQVRGGNKVCVRRLRVYRLQAMQWQK